MPQAWRSSAKAPLIEGAISFKGQFGADRTSAAGHYGSFLHPPPTPSCSASTSPSSSSPASSDTSAVASSTIGAAPIILFEGAECGVSHVGLKKGNQPPFGDRAGREMQATQSAGDHSRGLGAPSDRGSASCRRLGLATPLRCGPRNENHLRASPTRLGGPATEAVRSGATPAASKVFGRLIGLPDARLTKAAFCRSLYAAARAKNSPCNGRRAGLRLGWSKFQPPDMAVSPDAIYRASSPARGLTEKAPVGAVAYCAADASPQKPQREEWTGAYPRYGLYPRAARRD